MYLTKAQHDFLIEKYKKVSKWINLLGEDGHPDLEKTIREKEEAKAQLDNRSHLMDYGQYISELAKINNKYDPKIEELKSLKYIYIDQYIDEKDGYTPKYFNDLKSAYSALYGKNKNGKTLKDEYIEILSVAIEKQKEDNKK